MVQNSQVKRTSTAKKNASVAALAMKIAKDKDDVEFKKAAKFKKLFVAAKAAVLRKFGGRAQQEWVKVQSRKASGEHKSTKK